MFGCLEKGSFRKTEGGWAASYRHPTPETRAEVPYNGTLEVSNGVLYVYGCGDDTNGLDKGCRLAKINPATVQDRTTWIFYTGFASGNRAPAASNCRVLGEGVVRSSKLKMEKYARRRQRKLMVIMDDRAARSFAEGMGVAFIGTAGMLFHGFVRKHLTLAELEDAVEELSKTIWLAPAVVAKVLRKAREAEQ